MNASKPVTLLRQKALWLLTFVAPWAKDVATGRSSVAKVAMEDKMVSLASQASATMPRSATPA